MSELAGRNTSAVSSPVTPHTLRPQPRSAWLTLLVGGAFVLLLLPWPKVKRLLSVTANSTDRWKAAVVLSLFDTGFRVLTAVIIAAFVAFVMAIVTASSDRASRFLHMLKLYTLIAAVPLLAWVYVVIAVPTKALNRIEATTAATLAIIFPLTVPFATTLRSASHDPIVRHARQLGAGRYWRSRLALRVAAPSMLDALRVASLAAWSVVLFAESQVTMESDQGIGGLLYLWSSNGTADFSRITLMCLALCVVAVLVAETINAAQTIVRHNNGPDY